MPNASHATVLAPSCDDDEPIATDRNSTALGCLTTAVDRSFLPRKVIAADSELTEQTLSKVLAGVQGIPGGLIDALPDDAFEGFVKQLGATRGLLVRKLAPPEINEQLVAAAQQLVRIASLASIRGRAVRAGLGTTRR